MSLNLTQIYISLTSSSPTTSRSATFLSKESHGKKQQQQQHCFMDGIALSALSSSLWHDHIPFNKIIVHTRYSFVDSVLVRTLVTLKCTHTHNAETNNAKAYVILDCAILHSSTSHHRRHKAWHLCSMHSNSDYSHWTKGNKTIREKSKITIAVSVFCFLANWQNVVKTYGIRHTVGELRQICLEVYKINRHRQI